MGRGSTQPRGPGFGKEVFKEPEQRTFSMWYVVAWKEYSEDTARTIDTGGGLMHALSEIHRDSRHWLRDRRVLIPPAAVRAVDDAGRRLEVTLTRAQIEQSPPVDTAEPVSCQHHVDLYDYFGFPFSFFMNNPRRG